MITIRSGKMRARAVAMVAVAVLVACAFGCLSCDVAAVSSPPTAASDWGCAACAPVAMHQNNPGAVVVDGSAVYWINRGAVSTQGAAGAESVGGSVMKASRNGGAPIVLDSGLVSPLSLVIDGESLYWATRGTSGKGFRDGAVVKVEKDGTGGALVVSGLEGAGLIAVNDVSVFWVASGDETATAIGGPTLFRAAKDGTGATRLASVPGVTALSADESGVYVIDQTALKCIRNDTDKIEFLVDDSRLEGGTHLVLDDARAYWSSSGGESSPGIFSVGKNGIGLRALVSNVTDLRGLIADGAFVYWTLGNEDDWGIDRPATIWKAPLSGGDGVELASVSVQVPPSSTGWAEGLAVDASHVYATGVGLLPGDEEGIGEVIEMPK